MSWSSQAFLALEYCLMEYLDLLLSTVLTKIS